MFNVVTNKPYKIIYCKYASEYFLLCRLILSIRQYYFDIWALVITRKQIKAHINVNKHRETYHTQEKQWLLIGNFAEWRMKRHSINILPINKILRNEKKCFADKNVKRDSINWKSEISRLRRKNLQNQHFHINKLYATTILKFKIHSNNFLIINSYVVKKFII